ncbi:MAG TPA: tetratricopeptide repeat protein [Vicinamibacterales bacterium]|nr:tetratricopeptide repeat protein [Vicinamibacterales bacterium]
MLRSLGAPGALCILCGLISLGCARHRAEPRVPTFAADVAPILFTRCAPCHHPGGPAPFSLLTYAEARRRARQIADLTARREMPPWLPEPGYGEFEGERRLHPDEIDTLQRWAAAGAPEGDPRARPPAPAPPPAWPFGTPDLILVSEATYTLPAEGGDVFHNLVFRAPVRAVRWVRAVAIRPGNPNVVHHANVLVDRSGVARARDAAEPGPGFAGMDVETEFDEFEPDSHFLFWKPGSPPVADAPDMAWRLDDRTDLVLNLHLQPSGKPEPIRPAIGLYFTDRPPSRFPMLLQLEHDGALDIPPGARAFVVSDEYRLPVDVEVLGIYPHAHYLGRDLRATAELPDGRARWLIWIRDWNFAWQAVYRYRRPVFLPRGSTIRMRFTYDNSAANPRNPSDPPRRVTAGNRAIDEMAHLWLQVLPRRAEDRLRLQEALMRRRLEKYPGDFVAQVNLGAVLQALGRLDEALGHLQAAVAARPNDARGLNSLGAALRAAGRPADAADAFRRAVAADPRYLPARYNLGITLLALDRPREAAAALERLLALQPDDADAHNDLGSALAMLGRLDAAARHFERAIALDPAHRYAHGNLARLRVGQGRLAEAAVHLERAVALDPADASLRDALARVRAALGDRSRH